MSKYMGAQSTVSTVPKSHRKSSSHVLLASELITAILECLEIPDLIRCISVCKDWKSLIETTSRLQYILQLARAGMEDGTLVHPVYSSSSRLQLLGEYQESWKSFKFTESTIFDMGTENSNDTWEAMCDVVAKCVSYDSRATITLLRVPSRIRGIEKKEWIIDLPYAIADFTLDPAQDLLVVIDTELPSGSSVELKAHQIHILSMSTGDIHPLAEKKTLSLHSFPDILMGMETFFDFRVYEDLLGITGEGTEIWNWKSGASLQPAPAAQSNFDSFDSFAFIDTKYLLFARGDSPILEVVNLETWETVLRIFLPSSGPTTMEQYTGSIIIHPDCSSCSTSSLFTHEHSDRLFAASYENPDEEKFLSCTMFFKRSALMELITGSATQKASIEIKDATKNTNFDFIFSDSPGLSQVWTCAVHGLRVIIELEEEQENCFTVRDYSKKSPEVTSYTWPTPKKVRDLGPNSILGSMLLADGLVVVTGDESGNAFEFNIMSL